MDRTIQRFIRLVDRLRLLGPANVLARGYSITKDARTQKVIRSVKNAPVGTQMRTQLADGGIESTVD